MTIKNFVTASYAKMIYQDEIGDAFILCKKGEIHAFDTGTVVCTTFDKKALLRCEKYLDNRGFDENDDVVSGSIYQFKTKVENLDAIIDAFGRLNRRIRSDSDVLPKMEKRLGHKIRPYNPVLAETPDEEADRIKRSTKVWFKKARVQHG